MANSFVGTRVCYRRDIRENRRDEAGPQFINNPTGQGKRKQGYWKLSAGFGNKIEIEIGEVQRGIPYYLDAGSGTIVPRQNFYLDFVWTLIVHSVAVCGMVGDTIRIDWGGVKTRFDLGVACGV